MAQIKTSTNYHYKGLNLTSLKQVKEEVENSIGRIIDQMGSKEAQGKLSNNHQRLNLLHLLTNKETREQLKELLTVELETYDEETTGTDTQNIFDIKEA